jgi:hypothetical protein
MLTTMSLADHLLEPDDEGLDAGECMGDPYACRCDACRTLWTEIEADRAYNERDEAA